MLMAAPLRYLDTTPNEEIDAALARLDEGKDVWARLSISDRIALLRGIVQRTDAIAARWVDEATDAKGIPDGSPLAGEEWSSGPWALIAGADHLARTLEKIASGDDLLDGVPVRRGPAGRAVAEVHPADIWDRLLVNGVEAEVWMQPGVTPENLPDHMAEIYREGYPPGKVALVLGAGNIASIPPLDMLYKLFIEGQVCITKMNPVNEYLGPIFEEIFADFIERGFAAFAYGGVDVGKYLTTHDVVDEIHITGSEATHDAIVFGVGDEGRARKEADDPVNDRRVTSELGGIGPTIVVPGPWTQGDIEFQAENIVSMKMHNGGFNCIAAQVLVLSQEWEHKGALLDAIKQTFREVEPRTPYYPGAEDRLDRAKSHADRVVEFDPSRALLEGIDPNEDHYAFTNEFFCGALAQTALPQADPEAFLRSAVKFANTKLRGTLGCQILIHPSTLRDLGSKFDEIIADLEYGTIGVNAWSGVGFLLARATWGAFPGHPRNDIESGVGVVHNALMFDKPERTVVRAPFRSFPAAVIKGEATILPKPPWFVTNKTAHETMRLVTYFAANPSPLKLPAIFAAALRG
jgi:aldehyde dehydrogenase (NAD(P)+)